MHMQLYLLSSLAGCQRSCLLAQSVHVSERYIGSIIISVDEQHELYSQQSTLAHIREAFNEFGNGLVNNMDPTLGSNVMKVVFTMAVKACNERSE